MIQSGQILDGRYVLGRQIAEGGFGAVWSARHNRTEQDVAIKVLSVDRGTAHEGAIERFLREVKITASLRHPNTIRVFDFGGGEPGIPLYLVMERLHGPNVEDVLRSMRSRQRVMSERAAVDIALAILGSLAEAHEHGLVHRDLKPGNVMLNQVSGNVPVVKVLDFGCSYVRGSTLTDKGAVFGTLGYMSPEQIRGQDVDHRSDLFSLGLILFRAVTGEMPFTSTNNVTLLYQYASTDVPDPRDVTAHQITDDFATIINTALHRERDKRFASAGAMRTALLGILPKVRRRPAFTDSDMNSPLRRTQVPESLPRSSGELGALVRVALDGAAAVGAQSSLHTESATGLFDGQAQAAVMAETDEHVRGLGNPADVNGSNIPSGLNSPSRPGAFEAPVGLPSAHDASRAVAHAGKQNELAAAEIGGATLEQRGALVDPRDQRARRMGSRTGTEPSIPVVQQRAAEPTIHQQIPKLAMEVASADAGDGAASGGVPASDVTEGSVPPARAARWPAAIGLLVALVAGLVWWGVGTKTEPVGESDAVAERGQTSAVSPVGVDARGGKPALDAELEADAGAAASGERRALDAESLAADGEQAPALAEKPAASAKKPAASAASAKRPAANARKTVNGRGAAKAGQAKLRTAPRKARRSAAKPARKAIAAPPPPPPPTQARPKLKPAVFND